MNQGETISLSLVARLLTPGSILQQSVNTEAVWTAEPANVLTLVGPGRIQGGQGGVGVVTADYRDKRATLKILVPSAGLHRLSGVVYEGSNESAVTDAKVEVVRDPNNVAVTDFYGSYRLFVAPGTVRVRAVKDGYRPREQSVMVRADTVQNFELRPTRPLPGLAGTYTLTISAAEECRQASGLPEDLWTRQYVATISQQASELSVGLSGATFAPFFDGDPMDAFGGRVSTDIARFSLTAMNPWTESLPAVVEDAGSSRHLIISGEATVDLPTTRGTGTLNGRLELFTASLWSRNGPPAVMIADCLSDRHQFTLSN